MDEGLTVAIVAVAAVGLVLIYENQQAQQVQEQLILAKALQGPTVINAGSSSSSGGLGSLISLVTKVVGAL